MSSAARHRRTLTADDSGAHEAGSQAPSAVEVSRVQEKDLPRRLRLHFANFLHDHEPSEQAASRITSEAVNELDVELAISMEPDTAAQLAEIILYEAYVSRNTYRFALDNTWLRISPRTASRSRSMGRRSACGSSAWIIRSVALPASTP